MEEKKELIDMAELEKLVGVTREIEHFSIKVLDDLSIEMRSEHGWVVNIPPLTETWATWVMLVASWDESAQRVVTLMLKGVMFPTLMRIIDIDSEYISDIMEAHNALTGRALERGDDSSGDGADSAAEEERDFALAAALSGIVSNKTNEQMPEHGDGQESGNGSQLG